MKKAKYSPSITAEPGSLVMLTAAYLAGSAEGGRLTVTGMAVFLSLLVMLALKPTASGLLGGKPERPAPGVIAFAGLAAAGLLYSVVKIPLLVWLYLPGGLLYILHVYFFRKGRPVLSEAFGMAIMGLSAAIGAVTAGGPQSALPLGALFFVFYLASSFRVRLLIPKYRKAALSYAGSAVFLGLVLALGGYLFFLPLMVLSEDVIAALVARKEKFRDIGLVESAKTVIFAVLAVALLP